MECWRNVFFKGLNLNRHLQICEQNLAFKKPLTENKEMQFYPYSNWIKFLKIMVSNNGEKNRLRGKSTTFLEGNLGNIHLKF